MADDEEDLVIGIHQLNETVIACVVNVAAGMMVEHKHGLAGFGGLFQFSLKEIELVVREESAVDLRVVGRKEDHLIAVDVFGIVGFGDVLVNIALQIIGETVDQRVVVRVCAVANIVVAANEIIRTDRIDVVEHAVKQVILAFLTVHRVVAKQHQSVQPIFAALKAFHCGFGQIESRQAVTLHMNVRHQRNSEVHVALILGLNGLHFLIRCGENEKRREEEGKDPCEKVDDSFFHFDMTPFQDRRPAAVIYYLMRRMLRPSTVTP